MANIKKLALIIQYINIVFFMSGCALMLDTSPQSKTLSTNKFGNFSSVTVSSYSQAWETTAHRTEDNTLLYYRNKQIIAEDAFRKFEILHVFKNDKAILVRSQYGNPNNIYLINDIGSQYTIKKIRESDAGFMLPMAGNPNYFLLANTSYDDGVIFDEEAAKVYEYTLPETAECSSVCVRSQGTGVVLSISPDGERIALVNKPGSLMVIDIKSRTFSMRSTNKRFAKELFAVKVERENAIAIKKSIMELAGRYYTWKNIDHHWQFLPSQSKDNSHNNEHDYLAAVSHYFLTQLSPKKRKTVEYPTMTSGWTSLRPLSPSTDKALFIPVYDNNKPPYTINSAFSLNITPSAFSATNQLKLIGIGGVKSFGIGFFDRAFFETSEKSEDIINTLKRFAKQNKLYAYSINIQDKNLNQHDASCFHSRFSYSHHSSFLAYNLVYFSDTPINEFFTDKQQCYSNDKIHTIVEIMDIGSSRLVDFLGDDSVYTMKWL